MNFILGLNDIEQNDQESLCNAPTRDNYIRITVSILLQQVKGILLLIYKLVVGFLLPVVTK